jgi:hypothetical protein
MRLTATSYKSAHLIAFNPPWPQNMLVFLVAIQRILSLRRMVFAQGFFLDR